MSQLITQDEFHEALHSDLDKSYRPSQKRSRRPMHGRPARGSRLPSPDPSHTLRWATATINPRTSSIDVQIRLKFITDDLSQNDAKQLRKLAKKGIERFWSGKITIGKQYFQVHTSVKNRQGPNALPLDLRKTPPGQTLPSYNPSIPWLTEATLTYNEVYGANQATDDAVFQSVAAHEVGHSILTNARGYYFSWTHKGTSTLMQVPLARRPKYSKANQLDLMSYYNGNPFKLNSKKILNKAKAFHKDIKRLIFGAQIEWKS